MRELPGPWRARLVVAVGGPALLAAAILGATYTPVFHARHIDVTGERALKAAQVMRIAGVDEGTNVFHLDPQAVEASLRENPWIADADVERDLPSTVRIRITERRPVAQVTIDGSHRPVADDGTVLPSGDPAGLPEVRASVGELDEAGWTSGARALAAMTPAVRARVTTVVVAPDATLTLEIDAGIAVAYGPSVDDAAKAAALRAILAWAAGNDVALATIDLTVPDAPTATTTDGQAVAP